MPFKPPYKIVIQSDKCELELMPGVSKGGLYYYKYIKAHPLGGKLGLILPIKEDDLIKLIKRNL